MKTYLFYDVETSGLNPAFDQILTFAAIRTDLGLNELAREEICIRLRHDIVPSPGAFLTHCLTPDVLEQGTSEYEAALKIHRLFNTPGTVSCGYNSLGFDDEFLRFMFYRNLLDPYAHQFANGCSRMDMLPVTVIYRLFCPNALSWPQLPGGRATLKLEYLSRENRFDTSGRAHEAISDVEALMALARAFVKEKDVWNYVLGFFDKSKEVQRILGLKETIRIKDDAFRTALMVSSSFGPDANYIAPVLHLGGSVPYANQSLWLRLDRPDLLAGVNKDSGLYDFMVIRKRPGDQLLLLPAYERFWGKVLSPGQDCYRENLAQIRQNAEQFLATVHQHRQFKYPDIPDLDLDAALYQDGFFSPREKQDMAEFHRRMLAGEINVHGLSSERIRDMAMRIVYRNCSDPGLADSGTILHLSRLAGRSSDLPITGYKNDTKRTCAGALAELAALKSSGTQDLEPVQRRLIEWLESHITGMSASLTQAF